MLKFLRTNIAFITASIALGLSGCQMLGLQPLPNVYENAETVSEKSLVTIKSFGAAQKTLISVCEGVAVNSVEGDTCVTLISVEQTLRPGVRAAARVGAEYADIDIRIKSMGSKAPADWLVVAGEAAGRLTAVYGPIRNDVEEFIVQAGELTGKAPEPALAQ